MNKPTEMGGIKMQDPKTQRDGQEAVTRKVAGISGPIFPRKPTSPSKRPAIPPVPHAPTQREEMQRQRIQSPWHQPVGSSGSNQNERPTKPAPARPTPREIPLNSPSSLPNAPIPLTKSVIPQMPPLPHISDIPRISRPPTIDFSSDETSESFGIRRKQKRRMIWFLLLFFLSFSLFPLGAIFYAHNEAAIRSLIPKEALQILPNQPDYDAERKISEERIQALQNRVTSLSEENDEKNSKIRELHSELESKKESEAVIPQKECPTMTFKKCQLKFPNQCLPAE